MNHITDNTPKPTDRGVRAESLLMHFVAEAHRRKWDYDRGLDGDGVPIKSEAFTALHRLGEDMRLKLDELRRLGGEPQPGNDETEDPARIDRLRPEFFEHSSVEAIDSQIRRAQTQQRAWVDREQTLSVLRQARIKQKELNEWPAAAQSDAECQP